jgi:hypothetical protein
VRQGRLNFFARGGFFCFYFVWQTKEIKTKGYWQRARLPQYSPKQAAVATASRRVGTGYTGGRCGSFKKNSLTKFRYL